MLLCSAAGEIAVNRGRSVCDGVAQGPIATEMACSCDFRFPLESDCPAYLPDGSFVPRTGLIN
jgi:hypothetical protein